MKTRFLERLLQEFESINAMGAFLVYVAPWPCQSFALIKGDQFATSLFLFSTLCKSHASAIELALVKTPHAKWLIILAISVVYKLCHS